MTVHVLLGGRALCGKPGVPGEWNDGDRWVRVEERGEATCLLCSTRSLDLEASANDQRARDLIERADRGEGRADIKLVADYLRGNPTTLEAQQHQPPKLGEEKRVALAGLFAAEGRTLLQLLFGWRDQGSLARWTTGQSKALALFADYLRREYPRAAAAAGASADHDFQRPTAFCDYEGCDDDPTCVLPGNARMCSHHAAVSLLAGMTAEDAKSTFKFARPLPEDPWSDGPPILGSDLQGIRFSKDGDS